MAKWKELMAEARQLRDELEVQLHLMNMDLKDRWHELSDDLHRLEKAAGEKFLSGIEQVGKAEEAFYAGSEEDLKKIVDEFKTIKREQKDQ